MSGKVWCHIVGLAITSCVIVASASVMLSPSRTSEGTMQNNAILRVQSQDIKSLIEINKQAMARGNSHDKSIESINSRLDQVSAAQSEIKEDVKFIKESLNPVVGHK